MTGNAAGMSPGMMRRVLEPAALVIVLAQLVWAIGSGIESVTYGWWYVGGSVDITDVGIAGVAVILVLMPRMAFEWPEGTPTTLARQVYGLAIVVAVLLVFSTSTYALQAWFDHIEQWSTDEQIGRTISAVAEIGAAVALALVAVTGLRALPRRTPADAVEHVDPAGASPTAGGAPDA